MKSHEFTLILTGVDEETKGLEDAIFEAGCDDSLINFRDGTVYLDFDRKAKSFEEAVFSAITALESTPLPIKVSSVSPDSLVSASEIGKRINKGRQTVSLWAKRARSKSEPFPAPIFGLRTKRPLWRWCDVACWLHQQELIDSDAVELAEAIEGINSALVERNPVIRKFRDLSLKAIGGKSL